MKSQRIRSHYARRVAPDRAGYDVLDWGSKEAQHARFQVLADVLRELDCGAAAPRLLDVGCGLAELAAFLAQRHAAVRYVGVDLAPEVLHEARRRAPTLDLAQADVFAAAPFAAQTFEVTFCSGIFNLRLGNNDAFVRRALPRLAALTRAAVVANFLHRRARRQYPHCHYFDPAAVCAAAARVAARVDLVDDYLENDFTVVLWR